MDLRYEPSFFTGAIEHGFLLKKERAAWKLNLSWKGLIKWWHFSTETKTIAVAKVFLEEFKSLEFKKNLPEETLQNWLTEADKILHRLTFQSEQGFHLRHQFERHLNAYRYRSGKWRLVSPSQENIQRVREIAEKWKIEQEQPALDENKIQETCRYKLFADSLLKDPIGQKNFFNWIFRDRNSVESYVLMPALADLLHHSLLPGRLGYRPEFGLQLRDGKATLLADLATGVKPIDMHDLDQELTFRGIEGKTGIKISLRELLDHFKKKNAHVGPFEFCETEDGKERAFRNWHVHQHGPTVWNADKKEYEVVPIPLDREDFYRQLPGETLSLEEVQKRYGKEIWEEEDRKKIDGKQFLLVVRSTVQNLERPLDGLGTHAFFQIGVPNEEGTHYQFYSPGQFANDFPNSSGLMSFIANTVPARLEIPDSNLCYFFRKHAMRAWPLHAEEGKVALEILKKKLKKSRNQGLYFQVQGGACAMSVEKGMIRKLEKVIGRTLLKENEQLFYVHMTAVHPSPILFRLIRNVAACLPQPLQNLFLGFVFFFFLLMRTLTVKRSDGTEKIVSLWTSKHYKEKHLYLPAWLNKTMEERRLIPG